MDEPATTYAHPDDPHLVILAHPCEALILEEIGYTYKAVTLGGRLVAVELNPTHADILRRRFPHCEVIQDSAEHLEEATDFHLAITAREE